MCREVQIDLALSYINLCILISHSMTQAQLLEPGKCLLNSIDIQWLKTFCLGGFFHILFLSFFNGIILSLHPLCIYKLIFIPPSEVFFTINPCFHTKAVAMWTVQAKAFYCPFYMWVTPTFPKHVFSVIYSDLSSLWLSSSSKTSMWSVPFEGVK